MNYYLFPKNPKVSLTDFVSTSYKIRETSDGYQKLERMLFRPMLDNLIECRKLCDQVGAINAFTSMTKPVIFNDPSLVEYMIVGPVESFLLPFRSPSIIIDFEIVSEHDNGFVCIPVSCPENAMLLQSMYDIPNLKLSTLLNFLDAPDCTGILDNMIDIKMSHSGILFASDQPLLNPSLIEVTDIQFNFFGGSMELSDAFHFTHNNLSHEKNTFTRTA